MTGILGADDIRARNVDRGHTGVRRSRRCCERPDPDNAVHAAEPADVTTRPARRTSPAHWFRFRPAACRTRRRTGPARPAGTARPATRSAMALVIPYPWL